MAKYGTIYYELSVEVQVNYRTVLKDDGTKGLEAEPLCVPDREEILKKLSSQWETVLDECWHDSTLD